MLYKGLVMINCNTLGVVLGLMMNKYSQNQKSIGCPCSHTDNHLTGIIMSTLQVKKMRFSKGDYSES